MTPQEYLELSERTCKKFPQGEDLSNLRMDLLHATLGIAGEAGELVDSVKKSIIYNKPIDLDNLYEEAGDILWYMALLLRTLNVSFEQVMELNIDKLKLRYPDQYSDEAAVARADKAITGETQKSGLGDSPKTINLPAASVAGMDEMAGIIPASQDPAQPE